MAPVRLGVADTTNQPSGQPWTDNLAFSFAFVFGKPDPGPSLDYEFEMNSALARDHLSPFSSRASKPETIDKPRSSLFEPSHDHRNAKFRGKVARAGPEPIGFIACLNPSISLLRGSTGDDRV